MVSKFKVNQCVSIKDNLNYSSKIKGMRGLIVEVKDNGVNLHLNAFNTCYQDNILFFPFNAIK